MKFLKMMIILAFVALIVPDAKAQGPEKRRTGNTCTTDTECPDNAFCKSGSYCVCKEGFIFAASVAASVPASSCLKVGKHGDTCQVDVQCHTVMGVHAECLQGSCSCQPKTQLVGDRCYRKVVVGELCLVDHNCFLAGAQTDEQAYCVRGYCTCQFHSSPRDNGTRCVRDAVLGEKCLDNDQCAGVGLECRKTCQCREGFQAHQEINICVASVTELGGACEYDVQCASLAGVKDSKANVAAMCQAGVCKCSQNAHQVGNPKRCYLVRRPGQQCKADQECLNEEDEPGFCQRGRCTCNGCVPDDRDFHNAGAWLTPLPLVATILAAVAVLA